MSTRTRLHQWAAFQVPGPRDSAPIAVTLLVTVGIVLTAVCGALVVGALL